MNKSDYERLLHAAKEMKGWLTPTEVCAGLSKLGYPVSNQTMTNWKSRGMSSEAMLKASALIGCRPLWIESGQGEMKDAFAGLPDVHGIGETPDESIFAWVPHLDVTAACGDGRFTDHVVVRGGLAFKRSFLRDVGIKEADARVIYASGLSMSPTIQDGCVVLLNLGQREPRDGKVFAICGPDGDVILKRLVWDFSPAVGAQAWIIRSDNPDKTRFPDKLLPPDDRTMIAGQAIWNDNKL